LRILASDTETDTEINSDNFESEMEELENIQEELNEIAEIYA